jgi:ankyrin repeat protein
MLAIKEGRQVVSRFLCENGADVDATDINERTALRIATIEGNLDLSMLLCESGANVNATGIMDEQL